MMLADETASTGTISWLLPDNLGTIRDEAQFNSGTGGDRGFLRHVPLGVVRVTERAAAGGLVVRAGRVAGRVSVPVCVERIAFVRLVRMTK